MTRTKRTAIRKSREEKVFSGVSTTIILLATAVCLLPFLRVIAEAFSSDVYVMSGDIWFWPKGFTLKNIRFILDTHQFTRSMSVSVSSTLIFTVLAVFLTILLAYPLSRKYLPRHNAMMFFVTFTMMFNGGIIPTYMMVKALNLTNTFWALIVPTAISAYNTLILVTAFRAIPDDFEEAALVEGAGYFRILFQIMIPLCKSTIAVLVLYYAVSRWNSWFDAVMYINDMELFTLPIVIRKVLLQGKDALSYSLAAPPPTLSIQSAAVIFSVFPILILYPFLQKYFVKGVMIGGIKG